MGAIPPEIRERMRKARAIADDPRTDPGTRDAARNRLDAMIAKHGDPDGGARVDRGFDNVAGGWGRRSMVMDDLVDAMQRMARASTMAARQAQDRAFREELSKHFTESAMRSKAFEEFYRTQRAEHDRRAAERANGMNHPSWVRNQAILAGRWMQNFSNCFVSKTPDGKGWLIHDPESGRRYDGASDQNLVDFAMMKGWDGK